MTIIFCFQEKIKMVEFYLFGFPFSRKIGFIILKRTSTKAWKPFGLKLRLKNWEAWEEKLRGAVKVWKLFLSVFDAALSHNIQGVKILHGEKSSVLITKIVQMSWSSTKNSVATGQKLVVLTKNQYCLPKFSCRYWNFWLSSRTTERL